MDRLGIENIIVKYINKSATKAELEVLTEWLKTTTNKKLFDDFVETHHIINYSLNHTDSEKLIEQLESEFKKSNPVIIRRGIKSLLKYAAIFISVIGMTCFLVQDFSLKDEKIGKLITTSEDIVLELENGIQKIIDTRGIEKLIDKSGNIVGIQNGKVLNYSSENELERLAYNRLTVPNGEKLQLVLSDGTEIYLNSGTSIKYPIQFKKEENRKVYLLTGEAYFKVSKDVTHPFIVNANEMNVRVLGTEFNISSYPEDQSIATVLVNGSVKLYGEHADDDKKEAFQLEPGEKADWNRANGDVSIDKVDTNIYTSWKHDKLIFKDEPFKNILKKLERHYNVSIVSNNKFLNEKRYDATFDIETIEQVLETLNKNFPIQYSIVNNQVIIN